MLDIGQFRDYIVAPTLRYLDLHTVAAEQLILGTAAHESHLTYIHQLGGGPALSLFQMEPATEEDHWGSFLAYRDDLASRVRALLGVWPDPPAALTTNFAYAAAMCRIHYLRVSEALPAQDDVAGFGAYWKTYYNTPQGAGTIEEFVKAYVYHVQPLYTD